MRNRLYKILGGLVSKATKKNTLCTKMLMVAVLPEELLEDAQAVILLALRKPVEFQLNELEINALGSLLTSIKQNSGQIDLEIQPYLKKRI